jgi:competence protein ComEC
VTALSATSQAKKIDNTPHDFRFALIASVSWGAILIVLAIAPPLWVQGVVWGVAVLGFYLFRHRQGLAPALGAVVLSGVTLASLAVVDQARNPEVLTVSSGEYHEIVVELTTTAIPGTGHLTGVIHQVDTIAVRRVPVMLYVTNVGDRLPLGTLIEARARLTDTPWWDSRGWVGPASETRVYRPPPAVFAAADLLREQFLHRALALGGDAGALLPGLSLGDTTGVPADLEHDMRQAALAHLVAVSGANCALVVGVVVWLTGLFGGSVRLRFVTGTLALVGFVILVTPEPSVIRAAIMAVVVLLALAIGRPFRGIPVLALVVWVLLLLDPWRAIDVAFVLSVAATAGILLGFRWWVDLLERVMPTPLAWFVALPLSAQIAVQPVIILLRPSLPVWGVVANVLAAPAAPLVTLFGLLGSLVGPLVDPLGGFFTWLGWFPAAWIAAIARTVSALPIVELPWIPGVWGSLALGIATALVVVGVQSRERLAWWGGGLAIVVGGVFSQALPAVVVSFQVPQGWSVAQCDVGQGDSLVYQTPGQTVVIDTGDDHAALSRCLGMLSVERVDYLVLTHFDRDHVGATEVFHGITDVVVSGPPDNDHDRNRLARLADTGSTIIQVQAGDQLFLDAAVMTVLWPTGQPLVGPGNPSSIVVSIIPGEACSDCVSLVALGDLDETAQRMLLERYTGSTVEVVKVSHHGSPDQFPKLYDRIGARIGLIGVGADNDYGHPAPTALDFLTSQGHTIVRTDQHGTSVIGKGDAGLRLWHSGGS